MSGISPEMLAKAAKALESVRDDWLARPGVTAVDLGFKWTDGQMTDQLSIRVHVALKKDMDELSADELFPEEVDGIDVDVLEATYAPQTQVSARPEAAVEGRGGRFDEVPLGVSVGSKHSTAGTLGAKVLDTESGDEMILSNWHVLAGHPDAQEGLVVWQPGWIDGGTKDTNTIASLTRWIHGPYDAAVARLTGARSVKTTTLDGRSIVDAAAPNLGMMVWKSGRSTGFTEGFIDGVKMVVPLSYRHAGVKVLKEVFRVVPRPGAGSVEISIGGDSGSVWVDESSGKAVGLHFAGEVGDSPEHALAHDIEVVIESLGVRLPAQEPPVVTPVQPAQPTGQPAGKSSWWEALVGLVKSFFKRR
jgi:hypothetical protein